VGVVIDGTALREWLRILEIDRKIKEVN